MTEAPTTEGVYTLEDLKEAWSHGKRYKFAYFWESDCIVDEPTVQCFSQWYPSTFTIDGIVYSSALQFMMASKGRLFPNNNKIIKKIMTTKKPNKMKTLGREIKNFNQETWDKECRNIVFKANLAKFSQNEKMKKVLMSFDKNTIFVEANPHDTIWGIHLKENDPKARDPFQWCGQNYLGFQLTKVRDSFIQEATNIHQNLQENSAHLSNTSDKNKHMSNMISFAYHDVLDYDQSKFSQIESLDFLSTKISEVLLNNLPNLKRIRVSKCDQVTSIKLTNMPKLEVVDILDNEILSFADFRNCPNLVCVDAGFCYDLKQLLGIENVKYLNITDCENLTPLPIMPNLLYINLNHTHQNPCYILNTSLQLEFISSYLINSQHYKLSKLSSHPSLRTFIIGNSTLEADSFLPHSQLEAIYIHRDVEITGNQQILVGSGIIVANSQTTFVWETLSQKLKYQEIQLLLYGPWGVPDVDSIPSQPVRAIIRPPSNTNIEGASNAIAGAILASAVLDMIGVGVEFLDESQSKILLRGDADMTWSHPYINRHNVRFLRGTPTDDTSQNILIMRSLVYSNTPHSESPSTSETHSKLDINGVKIDMIDFGKRLIEWVDQGHAEHKHPGGLGCGATTYHVLNHPLFMSDPIQAAYKTWDKGGRKSAPNGAAMRSASSGCFAFWDENIVINIAKSYAKATHADPRCVYSSVAIALLVSRFIQYHAGLRSTMPDIDEALEKAMIVVDGAQNYTQDIQYYNNCRTLQDLNLAGEGIGYTLKALGSGIWALRYCNSINEGITKIIREGGDSDTNGAVVGALLGAKYGYTGIPEEYIKLMFTGQWMWNEMEPFMGLMGIKPPQSPYM
ncbi:hypothetical protein TRFO_35834 [Tritrichomonas foetus]|uniref:NADAR domain-containing protein n=1 Tax=Tritrichomonas foetus TaxID=1144522 RepID=A0A1J4JGS9_9EUKA|nr:hypothetical protein TRFO_35834 [Tritrichomonas foetus]|eukprot:OHS97873.1 hypothetical protein TRFO_35834 [Tritrichomonas foetus]